jgi:hypothetical protein
MKAITLHQPHAHLIAAGAKIWETRSWPTNHRGLLAIHAAKIQTTELDGIVIDDNARKPRYRKPYNRYLPADWNDYFGGLCHGGVVAIVRVKFCAPAEEALKSGRSQLRLHTDPDIRKRILEGMAFGDFSKGRFAWALKLICSIDLGEVVRGYQGLWNLPAAYELKLRAACEKAGIDLSE